MTWMWDRARQKVPYAAQGQGRLDFDEITFHVSRDHSIGYETANLGRVNGRFFVYVLIYIKFTVLQLILFASATVVLYFIQNLLSLNVQLRTTGRARNPMKSQTSHDSTRDGTWNPFALCLQCDGDGSGSKSKMHCSDLRMFQPFIFGRGDTCYQILTGKFHIQIQSVAGSWTPHSVGPKDLGSISVQVHFAFYHTPVERHPTSLSRT